MLAALAPYAAYVHVWNGRKWRREEGERRSFVSWESHYPESVRARNAELLDSWTLKTLDTLGGNLAAEDMFVFF